MLYSWYKELALLLSAIIVSVCFAFKIDIDTQEHLLFSKNEQPEIIYWCGTKSGAPFVSGISNQQWNEGKILFKSNCAACHNTKADGTGPPLMGVTERWQAGGKYRQKKGEEWMKVWIKNWHTAVDAGYPYAIAMARSRASEMNVFTSLGDKDIENILLYIEERDYNAPVVLNDR